MTLIDQASEVIALLNTRTGKRFMPRNPLGNPTTHAGFVMQRLKEGYTVQDCHSVIELKCGEWMHDDKMFKYLTPETLFRRSNFERYLGEVGANANDIFDGGIN